MCRGAQGPLETLFPERIAAAGIDHQLNIRSNSRARRLDDGLVQGVAEAAKRPPADLESAKSLALEFRQPLGQGTGLFHQQRGIRPDPVPVTAPQEPSDRLTRGLAQQVPQGDVNAADGMGHGAAPAQPEGVLVQLLAHALGFQGVLSAIQGLQQSQGGAHQLIAGEHAAQPDGALVGDHGDQGVDAVVGP